MKRRRLVHLAPDATRDEDGTIVARALCGLVSKGRRTFLAPSLETAIARCALERKAVVCPVCESRHRGALAYRITYKYANEVDEAPPVRCVYVHDRFEDALQDAINIQRSRGAICTIHVVRFHDPDGAPIASLRCVS